MPDLKLIKELEGSRPCLFLLPGKFEHQGYILQGRKKRDEIVELKNEANRG